MSMGYRKRFDPSSTQKFEEESSSESTGDAGCSMYVYTDEIVLAVNIALATGRPLLVRGPTGCGKSTLARNVARTLGRRYYESVITSRTQARDLLWEVDLLRRLQDAQAQQLAHGLDSYVSPGVLWWAFDQEGARAQVHRSRTRAGSAFEPGEYLQGENAVVLLDEIDKADPDVPNNLLVPLGALSFRVEETGEEVRAHVPPLVFLTTNDERDLPPAFVRRCVELKIKSPSSDQLIEVGTAHFTDVSENLLKSVAEIFASSNEFSTNVPSTAEYLDTVQACIHLGIEPGSELFKTLSRVTVWKHGRVAPTNEGL